MSYAELRFFDGQPVAHCEAWEESLRIKRRAALAKSFERDAGRRRGSRML